MAEPFLGEIRAFGFNFAPRGWAMCNGQILSIAQNTALFSLLGTTYGGNGQTTFGLPDLRGRVPIHLGQGPGLSSKDLGEQGGQEAQTLSVNDARTRTPSRRRAASKTRTGPETRCPRGAVYAGSGDGSVMDPTTTTGGSQPHNNMQPYLVLNYCIAIEGIYPSRN